MPPRLSQFLPVFTDIRLHLLEGKITRREYVYFLALLPEVKVQGGTGVVWINDPIMCDRIGGKTPAVAKIRRSLESKNYLRSFQQIGSKGAYPIIVHKWPLTRIPQKRLGQKLGHVEVSVLGDRLGLDPSNIPIGSLRVNAWSEQTCVLENGDIQLDTIRVRLGQELGDKLGQELDQTSTPLLRPSLETGIETESEKDNELRQAQLFGDDDSDQKDSQEKTKRQGTPTPYQAIFESYNEIIASKSSGWSNCRIKLAMASDGLRKKANARFREAGQDLDVVRGVFHQVAASDWLMTVFQGGSAAWILGSNNWAKVIAGNYDRNRNSSPRPQKSPQNSSGSALDDWVPSEEASRA